MPCSKAADRSCSWEVCRSSFTPGNRCSHHAPKGYRIYFGCRSQKVVDVKRRGANLVCEVLTNHIRRLPHNYYPNPNFHHRSILSSIVLREFLEASRSFTFDVRHLSHASRHHNRSSEPSVLQSGVLFPSKILTLERTKSHSDKHIKIPRRWSSKLYLALHAAPLKSFCLDRLL